MTKRNTLLRIAINAHLLAAEQSYRSAGISMYIDQLIRHLPDTTAPIVYAVFVGHDVRIDAPVNAVRQSAWATQSPLKRIIWEQTRFPWALARGHYDLVHAPAFVAPLLAPCPQVVTVHDLSFIRYPQFFRRGNRFYLRMMTRLSCRKAGAVIAVSRFTATEVNSLLGVPESRIKVIYHGVGQQFRVLDTQLVEQFRREKGLPDKYILYLGTLEPRKNLLRLINAYAQSGIRDMPLVLAGGHGWYYQDVYALVETLGLQDFVLFPGYIPAAELAIWYNAAWAFAYVSTYEGFGLPVLEALACGVPVLTSSTSSLPEAAGGHAIMVDPLDLNAIAEGLRRIVNDNALRTELKANSPGFARQFTWKRTAEETVFVYQSLLSVNPTSIREGI